MITDRDRLVMALGMISAPRFRVLSVICERGPLTRMEISDLLGLKRSAIQFHVTGLEAVGAVSRRLCPEIARTNPPCVYTVVPGVEEILLGLPERRLCNTGDGDIRVGLDVLRMVRELLAEDVWPSRRLVAAELGLRHRTVGNWMIRIRRWGLWPETDLTPLSSVLKAYASVLPAMRRNRVPKFRPLPISSYNRRVHRDHSH